MPPKVQPAGHKQDSVACDSFHESNKSEEAKAVTANLETNMRKNLKLMHAAKAKKEQDDIALKKREIEEKLLKKGDSIGHLNMIKPKY